jgi:hypothetical protein
MQSVFLSFRVHWIDAPVIIFCLWGATSSILHGKGLVGCLLAILENSILWGFPYVVGRVYFRDLESFRDLALGIVIGGLIYVPLCLIEIRVSPQLHIWIYGYHQHQFEQSIRFGGFRPTVFMQHGLAVAMWMVNATVLPSGCRPVGICSVTQCCWSQSCRQLAGHNGPL